MTQAYRYTPIHCVNARKLQPPTIKATIAGIQFHLGCLDHRSISLFNHPSISLLIKGISKAHPGKKDKRLPLTLPLLHKLLKSLRLGVFGTYSDVVLDSVLLTAFYGFLRCGEFTLILIMISPFLTFYLIATNLPLCLSTPRLLNLIKVSLLLYQVLILSFVLSFPCLGT